MPDSSDVTILLSRINEGDGKAPGELLPLVYDELRKLAQSYMQNERGEHTLQATALVHEAYIRLVDWEKVSWRNRAHFALDEALEFLEKYEKTQAKIVELRFFGGLTIEETAHALKISPATVKREWAIAKTWLYRRLTDE
jgi:hypothetical protein